MNEELKKLYDVIVSKGFYTKSYDDFISQYQDPAYRDRLFNVVSQEGLYTKTREEFDAKYAISGGLKKKEPSVSTSQEGAMAPATEAGSLASPKSKTVETTRADGTPVTVQWGPTGFKSSDEAPVPQFKTFAEMAGQVDATIDEPTKQKISQAIGITGAVFNKIVNPNASVPEAINQAKAFADNTQTAYNVGVLSGQISNNMQQSVPDKERIAKLNKELKQEQSKLLSSQMGADASSFFDVLASNPVTFLTEVLTTSAAQMATGVGGMRPEDLAAAGALTLATGVGGAAYMSGRNSLNAEMSSRIMGALEERGVDITDAAQLETAMTNRDLMMEIAGEVQAPATFVAALDALSAGMAGKLGKPIYEVLAQSLAGSVGEAGAQFIESGEITSPSAVLTEAIAELPGGLVETAFGAKTKDVQRKIEINRQLKDVEAQIERAEDEDTKSVLRSVADNLRNEKNKIYDDYAAFVNSLPEEDVARLNSLNEEIVKTSKAIDQVDNAATRDALKARRSALLKQVEQLENKQQDAIQEQATDESVLRPEQPEVGLQEVVEGDQEPQVAAEEVVQEEVGTVGTLLNERVVYDDPVSGQPVEGDLFVDGQRVVLEAAGGQQFDLGNVDEVLAQPIDGGIVRPTEMAIMPQEDGSFVFNKEDNQKIAKGTRMFNNQPGLQAITRDDAGNVKRVTLYSEDGAETYNLTGQEAEDAAYYIVRGFVETQEGQDVINQLAERNEEARRDLTQPLGVRPVQQVAPQAAVEVRAEVPAGPVVEGAAEVDAQELADLAADMQAAAPARRERLERIAERARKAVSKIMPDVKIIVHDTQEAYRAATTFEGEATYNNDTKTVHINGTKATPAAVAHEVFHAVFLDKVKTDEKAQAVAKKMVQSLKRVLGEDSEAYQYLDEFSKDYDANFQDEERLAEMVGVLSELYSGVNDIGLSPSAVQSVKNAIKKFITDLAKLFNIPMPTTLTDADVLAVLNTIAQKAVTGEVITEADVRTIDRVMAEDIESVESFFVNTELETPPAVEIKPRQRIGAQTNQEARESLERKGRKMFPSSTDDALTPDEVRVYFMDNDFNWLKKFSQPYEDVAKVFAEMASDPDFHLFPSITMQGAFMTMDTSNGRAEMETNIKLSPRDENIIYIEGIELFDPKLAGEGIGTKVMNRIIAAADKFGLTIQLDAYPTRRYQYDPKKGRDLSDKQLDKMADRLVTDFYSKFGFRSLDTRTKEVARFMERKPMDSASSVQMRERKGLITITEREAQKYARIGINDARMIQAMEDIGLAGVKFNDLGVYEAIDKAFSDAVRSIDNNFKTPMYNGKPAVITEVSNQLVAEIQRDLERLKKRGASRSEIQVYEDRIKSPELQKQYMKQFQNAQTATIRKWAYELEENSIYDPAFKLLMLDAVATYNYDSFLGKYIKRDSKTIRNITNYDSGTLAKLYGMTDSKELLKTYVELQVENFKNIVSANEFKKTNEGTWLKFAGGSGVTPDLDIELNASALSQIVQDTPWCTKSLAESQLEGGDFYVFVTQDNQGTYRSRIAIRMDGDEIGEVRGILDDQGVEPGMSAISEKFISEEFADGGEWLEEVKRQAEVDQFRLRISDKDLTIDDLFEYSKIISKFTPNGRRVDSYYLRDFEDFILGKVRNKELSSDLIDAIEFDESKISLKTRVVLGGLQMKRVANIDDAANVEVVIGSFDNRFIGYIPKKLRSVSGDVNLEESNQDISLEHIGGNFVVPDLLESLGNLSSVNGELFFSSNGKLKDLGKLEVINGRKLVVPRNLDSLGNVKKINGDLLININSGLKTLGNLEEISGILEITSPSFESFGNLKRAGVLLLGDQGDNRVFNGNSLGNIENVSDVLYLKNAPNITSLGNIKRAAAILNTESSLKVIDGNKVSVDAINLDAGNAIVKNFDYIESLTFGKRYTGKSIGSIALVNRLIVESDTIKSLGGVEAVYDDLFIKSRSLESLGDLVDVSNFLNISSAPKLKSLGKLRRVGGQANIYAENLTSLGELSYVNGISITSPIQSLEKIYRIGNISISDLPASIKSIGDLAFAGIPDTNFEIENETRVSGRIFQKMINSGVAPNEASEIAINAITSGAITDVSRKVYAINGFVNRMFPVGKPDQSVVDQIKVIAYRSAEVDIDNMTDQESKLIDLLSGVAPRQRKDGGRAYQNWASNPKSSAQKIGHKYNMNYKGFTPSTIVKQEFEKDVRNISNRLTVHRAISGGYFMRLDKKFFNPFDKVIGGQDGGPSGLRQRMGRPNENIFDIVTMARQKGYTDKTIEIYLKQEGFASEDIKAAMAVNSNIDGAQVPQEFGNVTGGMAQGQTLFDEIKAKLTKMAADGASMMDIRVEAQTLLMDSDVYKAQSAEVKAQLRLSLDATIGTKAADRAFRQEFKQLRAMLSDRKKARRELETIKRMMRGFIRKNLPQGEYSKAEVVALLKAIVDANVDTLPLVMEKVEGYVTGFKVRKLEKQIQKLLDTKTTGMVSGRQVGRVSVELQNQLAELNDKESPVLADDSMSEEAVESLMSDQLAEYNRIMSQTYISEQDAAKAQLLSIAMMYNDAYMMEDTNPNKVETLQSVVENLAAMIATGRAEIRAELDQQRAQYKDMVAEAYSEITGEQMDMSDTEDAKAANEKKIREAKNVEEKRKKFQSRMKGAFGKLSSFVDNYFTRQMDLPLLLSRITSVVTESFGGKLQETVDGRLFDARTEFTRRKMEVMKMLEQKQKEIFGKDYKNEMVINAVPRFSKDIVNDKDAVFTDMTEADKLRKEHKSANDKRRKAIVARLTELEVVLSPNQDYYLYNQYKDPANRASFSKKFGEENYAKAMEIITNRLDPKVKEWADWQVNELFPSLYEAYNEVYRAIYRTNMPWNQFYAGRIYREGKEGDNTFDLLQGSNEYRTSVGGQSTKARIKNRRPIQNIDGNYALNSYLEDMEYFRAYAEVMRDMQKLFDNPNIEAAINKFAGSNTYRALKDMMSRIATRGIKSNESQVVNSMINNFIVSKLGFNPTIMVKQLTSAIAFSDYIGWGNWSLYMAKAMPDAKKLWKEWYDNSPILQERYENSNMAEVLEGYKQTDLVSTPVLLDKKVFGKRILITDKNVSNWQNGLMHLIKVGDKGGVMGGLANYLYYKDEFKAKNPNATEQQAIDYASRKATRQAISTQQDSGITNKDWYQTAGPAFRFLNVFMSSPKALFRKEMYAVMQLYRKISAKSTKAGAGSLTDNLRTLITYHVGVPMLFQWVALGLPGVLANWDEEDEESLGRAAILGNLNALFIVGDLLLGIKDFLEDNPWAGEFKTLPIFEQASEIIQDMKAYSKAKKEETREKHLVKLINHTIELTGVPASSMYRMYNNLSELSNSDTGEAILRLLNFSEYVVEEKASEDK